MWKSAGGKTIISWSTSSTQVERCVWCTVRWRLPCVGCNIARKGRQHKHIDYVRISNKRAEHCNSAKMKAGLRRRVNMCDVTPIRPAKRQHIVCGPPSMHESSCAVYTEGRTPRKQNPLGSRLLDVVFACCQADSARYRDGRHTLWFPSSRLLFANSANDIFLHCRRRFHIHSGIINEIRTQLALD